MDDWDSDSREGGLIAIIGPCVEWSGYRDKDGYGQRGRSTKVHREAWMSAHGPIPPGMYVLHRCDNPPCYNIEHLYLGGSRQNQIDRRERHAPNGATHKLTRSDVTIIRAALSRRERQVDIAAAFGVAQTTISKIAIGKTWREVMTTSG